MGFGENPDRRIEESFDFEKIFDVLIENPDGDVHQVWILRISLSFSLPSQSLLVGEKDLRSGIRLK